MEKYIVVNKCRCYCDWIEELDYNFGLLADCVDSAADGHFFCEHVVASLTGRSDDVPVLRKTNLLMSSHIRHHMC